MNSLSLRHFYQVRLGGKNVAAPEGSQQPMITVSKLQERL